MTVEATAASSAAPVPLRVGRAAGLVTVALVLAAVGSRNGGYFPTTWGWSIVLFAWGTLLAALLLRSMWLPKLSLAFLASLTALLVWTGLSAFWAHSPSAAVLEAERTTLYVSAIALLVLFSRQLPSALVLGGLLAGITLLAAYSLATRLFPASVGTYDPVAAGRLSTPLGYWNGLGLFCAVGTLLALGLVGRANRFVARAAAGASLVVVLPVMYLTLSRGAWVALAVGAVVVLLLERERIALCMTVAVSIAAPAFAVLVTARAASLTTTGVSAARALHDGHRVGASLAGLVALEIGVVWGWTRIESRATPSRALRMILAALLCVACVAIASTAVIRWGAPWNMASRGWRSFVAAPTSAVSGSGAKAGTNVSGRLFELSNNNRIASWRSAVREWEQRPLVGGGAGSFEGWWLQHRAKASFQIRDAHSLYLETMGELGVVGLVLLLATLAIPLVAAVKARHEPYVPFLAAAFVAWAVHAGVDWDWEIPAVTLPALVCAAVVCAAPPGRTYALGVRGRLGTGAAAAAIAVFGLVAGIGNQALASSQNALDGHNYAAAELQAKKAGRWAPWLSEPWIIEGQIAALGQDPRAAKRAFGTALAKDSSSYLAWYGLAGVTKGSVHRRAARQVIRLNPLSDEAKELRAGS